MNLLIVDDIATNRKLLRVTLEAEGHTTLEAADGVEAMQILARETVNAVISDILMPNMDGFRLCHEIRKSERLHALHQVCVSGRAMWAAPSRSNPFAAPARKSRSAFPCRQNDTAAN